MPRGIYQRKTFRSHNKPEMQTFFDQKQIQAFIEKRQEEIITLSYLKGRLELVNKAVSCMRALKEVK
jgi:hypothetical protein